MLIVSLKTILKHFHYSLIIENKFLLCEQNQKFNLVFVKNEFYQTDGEEHPQ